MRPPIDATCRQIGLESVKGNYPLPSSGLSSSGGRAGDLGGYQSDGDLVRSRLGQPGGYTSEGPYNEVSGYTSDNHYDRSAAEDK